MDKLMTGYMCLTDLVDAAKKGHSAFSRAKNGKVYFNFAQWIREEKDYYGNHSSFQLSSKKDKKEAEGKTYIGNAKWAEKAEPEPVQPGEINEPLDDLPF